MPFEPASPLLGTTDEYTNVGYTITYATPIVIGVPNTGGTSYAVTITPLRTNGTISVSSNNISGYYSDSFTDQQLYYRNKDDTFTEVQKFSDIDLEKESEFVHYFADPSISTNYTYLAEANGESQIYTVTVMNNWTSGRNALVAHIGSSYNINILKTSWSNGEFTVAWVNDNGNTIDWIRFYGINDT